MLAEWGMPPIPQKLLQRGVRDLVAHLGRADEWNARTDPAYSTFHRRAIGVACARRRWRFDRAHRGGAARLQLLVDDEVSRGAARANWVRPAASALSAWVWRALRRAVTQAHEGCGFRFLARR
jgi:hypothetical protein